MMLYLGKTVKRLVQSLCSFVPTVDKNTLLSRRNGVWFIVGMTFFGQGLSPAVVTANPIVSSKVAAASLNTNGLSDGTYLYGESPQPNQINRAYVIFTKQGNRVSGALYYPQSEFNCFTGTLNLQALAVQTWDFPQEKGRALSLPLTQMHSISDVNLGAEDSLQHCHQEVAQYLTHNRGTALFPAN